MSPKSAIQARLEAIPEIRGKYSFLEFSEFRRIYDSIYSTVLFEDGTVKVHLEPMAQRLDISNIEPEEVRHFLLSLEISENESIRLIWVLSNVGISIKLHDFIKHYDDLWYPSSDDVWLVNEPFTWFIEINHEETLLFIKTAANE